MSDTPTPAPKRVTRTRKTTTSAVSSEETALPTSKVAISPKNSFADLIKQIAGAEAEFTLLEKAIAETKEAWVREQTIHERELMEQRQQEALETKREQEAYDYDTAKTRRMAEDAFHERKTTWERELGSQQEKFAAEKKELEDLRKQVAGFETEKEKAVKEAVSALEKELQASFAQERKLRDQEVKAERELLSLRITTFSEEKSRQEKEIQTLKAALEEATRQLKDVAVRVIDAGNAANRTPSISSETPHSTS